MQRTYEEYRKVFQGLPKPFAFLDLDLLDHNIAQILDHSRGKQIRVASKSIRSTAVLRRILDTAPDRFSGIMCFTASEALYLASQGFDHLLLGYPVWYEGALRKLADAVRAGNDITLMVDSIEHVEHIERIAKSAGTVLSLCLDVDMSTRFPGLYFGVRRSPLRSSAQVQAVAARILASDAVRLTGLMGYEAQIAGVGDDVLGQGAKSRLIRYLKGRSTGPIAARRAEAVAAAEQLGAQLRFVNGGGTGSLKTTTREDRVTEVTVGSGFYSPGLFDHYRDFQYLPALGYAIEIVRQPAPGLVTCAGGGYVASGAAGRDKLPVPYLPRGMTLLPMEGAGEVQTPLRVPEHVTLSLGDPVFLRHSKAGELCERFNQIYCVAGQEIVDVISTYRGDGQCFL